MLVPAETEKSDQTEPESALMEAMPSHHPDLGRPKYGSTMLPHQSGGDICFPTHTRAAKTLVGRSRDRRPVLFPPLKRLTPLVFRPAPYRHLHESIWRARPNGLDSSQGKSQHPLLCFIR